MTSQRLLVQQDVNRDVSALVLSRVNGTRRPCRTTDGHVSSFDATRSHLGRLRPVQTLRRTGRHESSLNAHRRKASSSPTARDVSHTREDAHRGYEKTVGVTGLAALPRLSAAMTARGRVGSGWGVLMHGFPTAAVTVRQAAVQWNVSKSTATRWIAMGQTPVDPS